MNEPRQPIRVEISPGELLDKIAILEIKNERIGDADKRRNVRIDLASLSETRRRCVLESPALAALTAELKRVNAALWDIEDEIRALERAQDFGARFIELARSVYRQNDRRAALKRQINELLGSGLMEEKAYAWYDASQPP